MTRPPARPSGRVPGFTTAADAAHPSGEPSPVRAVGRLRATRQLNVRVRVDLYDRYRVLLRALEDAGVETSMSELVHALLEQGPRDVDVAMDVLRQWRRVSTDL